MTNNLKKTHLHPATNRISVPFWLSFYQIIPNHISLYILSLLWLVSLPRLQTSTLRSHKNTCNNLVQKHKLYAMLTDNYLDFRLVCIIDYWLFEWSWMCSQLKLNKKTRSWLCLKPVTLTTLPKSCHGSAIKRIKPSI